MKSLTAIIGASALLLTGCGSAGDPSNKVLESATVDDSSGLVIDGEKVASADLLDAARKGSVSWVTSSSADTANLTAERFKAETGVDIKVDRLPATKLNERVLSEAGVGRLSNDVITMGDPRFAAELATKNVFVPYTAEPKYKDLAAMPNVVWADGKYVTAYYTVAAIVYNNQAVKPEDAPKSWNDLLDPKWQGKVGVVSAGAGGAAQGLAAFQEKEFGAGYWTKFANQKPRIFDASSVQLDALARGEITVAPVAGINTALAAQKGGAPIKVVVPAEGVSGTLNLQGLTTTGKDNPAAQLFMNWTMSASGQKFAAAQGFVSSRTDIKQAATGDFQLPGAGDKTFVLYSADEAEKRGKDVINRWNAALGVTG
ncbi:ABC transporter substrate-binding protein [Pseudarthrobacter sp. YAF2]|uniref:ABC transporter substrate-binding protein n=1 Tax=Pseudarthrobacter sp. YAF2 TaxID=3233078 RepID=UPI003F95835A